LLLARDVAFSNNEALIYDTLIRPVVYLTNWNIFSN